MIRHREGRPRMAPGRTVPAVRDHRKPRGRGATFSGARSGPRRKGRQARLPRRATKNGRRRSTLVLILALVFGFGVGYSLLGMGDEGMASQIASAARPSAPAVEASEGQTRKSPAAATTCDDLTVLVDRSHTLPPDYAPRDLVPLQDYGVPTLGTAGGGMLRREAAEHAGRLVAGAAAEGQDLEVASAYRSYEDQRLSHDRLVSAYGAGAAKTSAEPGHSQHQLGTAVDFTNASARHQVSRRFAQTSAYWWLERHAGEYGFILAYPRGEEAQTGYRWEPWHYRYVGIEVAQRLEESNLTLQGFLDRAGTVPRC